MSGSSYFTPKFTGGSYSSIGYNYQDVCALFCMFDFLGRGEPVNSIGFEMINDFTINMKHQILTVQVKKQSLGVTEIKKILQGTEIKGNTKVMLIATDFKKDLEVMIQIRNQYISVKNSDLSIEWKRDAKEKFEQLLVNNNIDNNIRNLFMGGEFIAIPENISDLALMAKVYSWVDKEKISLNNVDHFIDTLHSKAEKYRSDRKELNIDELKEIVEEHSTETLARNIIKEAYESQFIKPSEILSVLGPTQKDILKSLEDKLMTAYDFIKSNDYNEALNVFLNLSNIYPTIEINTNCAILFEMIGEYQTAIEYCDKIIQQDPDNYAAYYIKGTSLGSIKRYSEGLFNLEKALSINKTSEVHYNLGYTYMVSAEHDTSKAIEHYKASLALDNSIPRTHQNISVCYFNYGNYVKSLYHIDKAIILDPSSSKAFSHKGELYRFLGLYDEALKYYMDCLKIDKDNYVALLGKSLCYVEKGFISEAIISFKNFFDKYVDKFFKKRKPSKNVLMVDLGWEKTRYITIELKDEKTVNVHINHNTLPITLEKANDYIFIGALPTSEENPEVLYPMVGKFYENKTTYDKVIQRLKKTVNLFQYFELPLYVNVGKDIEVIVKERDEYILIELIFAEEFNIVGITDYKTGGLEAFEDNFNYYGQCRIHLECEETNEIFVIDGIENVNLMKLN
ncbi:tetratricopeptide repeat protein [Siminovitchia terrae]|uniref:tetratricopeptide repeat protein n=1 Tax=Siminovitchia terrae TaxID=1914933 RepID=UPI0028AEADCF|nr:hypothetical protein [Siminovitchia terrae]